MKRRKGINFVVIKLRAICFAILLVGILALLCCSFGGEEALASVFLGVKRKIPIYSVARDDKSIAISFDAAWGSDKTDKILSILKECDTQATFFLVGMWVDKNEDLTKKIADMGHEIGTHSNTHKDFAKLTNDQILLELSTSKGKIERVSGKEVKLFRAPYGSYNNSTLEIAESLNLKTIQWDVDSLDWKGINSATICQNILKKVKSGSIILCHNNADYIVEALPTILTTLKARGYKFVTVSNLLLKGETTIDNTGKQIAKQN